MVVRGAFETADMIHTMMAVVVVLLLRFLSNRCYHCLNSHLTMISLMIEYYHYHCHCASHCCFDWSVVLVLRPIYYVCGHQHSLSCSSVMHLAFEAFGCIHFVDNRCHLRQCYLQILVWSHSRYCC